MPRLHHRTGPQGCPPELKFYEARFGISLRAGKLPRTLRQIARTDAAVATHLQRRIREPARFDALMAGYTRFTSDTPCRRCGSFTRTVYGSACWACATTRRPLQTDSAGRVTGWPPALRSRAGWLALCNERQRERAGETSSASFGPFVATTTPTGRLSVHAPTLGLAIPDLSRHPFDFINNIVQRYPEFLELLAWAGWT